MHDLTASSSEASTAAAVPGGADAKDLLARYAMLCAELEAKKGNRKYKRGMSYDRV